MKAPAKIEAEGMDAFDQVCAFEQLQRRRLPMIYGAITVLIAVCGLVLLKIDRPGWAVACLLLAIFFSVISWLNWKKLEKQYEKNLALLAELEGTYGDDLPWIQVEKHLAAVEQLKHDLEEEKRKSEE